MAALKSPLLDKKEDPTPPLTLDENESLYLRRMRELLIRARDTRDQTHDEFDGMSYIARCEQNRKLANSHIQPKKNRTDTPFTTGTPRQKMLALLASVNNLNLEADVTAFDQDNFVFSTLGEAVEGIMQKTAELENDDEKRLRRQYALLEQGEVFVEEVCIEERIVEKELKQKYDGKFHGVQWTKRLKKIYKRFERNIIRNENVYLGDITVFDIEKQPYLFTIQIVPYEEAKGIYGEWENWKHVSKTVQQWQITQDETASAYSNKWSLSELQQDHVEIVKYQNKWTKEYQIIINGTPMLPIAFPLPWKSGEYNITKQVLEVIDEHFAYGKSVMQRLKTAGALNDEFWRLLILRVQQAAKPPTANLTGKVLNSSIFDPGKINYGINPDLLKPLLEAKGPTPAEFNIIQMLSQNQDENSVNPTFQGQQPAGNPTATQIMEVQRQAKMVFGLTLFSCAMLEKKLGYLRLWNILEHWFDPVDQKVDEVRNELKNVYRKISLEKPIEGQGMGQQIIEVTEDVPPLAAQVEQANQIEKETGSPVQRILLNPKELELSKYIWQINVIPTEKRTSPLQKLLFQEMAMSFINLGLMPDPNWLRERAATVWGENPAKVFPSGSQPAMMQPGMQDAAKPVETPTLGQLSMSE